MRQYSGIWTYQARAVFSDGLAMFHVFVGELFGGVEREGFLLCDGLAGAHCFADVKHRVDGIDGGGAGGFECLENGIDVTSEFFQVFAAECARALGQSIRGGGADGTGSANGHVGDRLGGGAKVRGGDGFENVREKPLVNKNY